MTTIALDQPLSGRWPMFAGRMSFFVPGFLLASWAPLVPYARDRVGIVDDYALGFLLLSLGFGSIVAMAVAGSVASRLGCRCTIMISGVLGAAMLVGLGNVSSVAGLAAILCLFGAFIGMLEVTANIHAVQMEALVGRPIMSGFHSMYSIGGFAGAGGVSLLLKADLHPLQATMLAGMLVLALVVLLGPRLLGKTNAEPPPFFILPRGAVLVIGVMCFILFLIEGAVLDWSAVYLTTYHHVDKSTAGLGFSIFAIAMTCLRALGDRLVAWNRKKVVIMGSCLAAAGLAVVVLTAHPLAGFAGFFLVGVGAANIVPVLFSEAARQPEMPVELSLAAVSLFGYTGVLAGPALIGFTSSAIGLPTTFLLLALFTLLPALTAGKTLSCPR